MANSTASTLIGYGLQAAKVGDDTGIPGLDTTTSLLRIVDRENRNFIEAPWGVNQPGWDFMISERGYTIQAGTTTTGALTASSATVPVTLLENFANATVDGTFTTTGGAGVVYTDNIADPFLFAGASASSGAGNLTTATGLSFDHASGDAIYTLYQLPSDFGRPRAERHRGDGLTIEKRPYFYGGTGEPMGGQFSLFYDRTNDRQYLWLPRDSSGTALMRYDRAATSIAAVGTTVDVPPAHEEYIIQKVAAHVMRVLSKDADKIVDAENMAQQILSAAFMERSIGKRVHLTRGPIRSPSALRDHYMTSSGDIY